MAKVEVRTYDVSATSLVVIITTATTFASAMVVVTTITFTPRIVVVTLAPIRLDGRFGT